MWLRISAELRERKHARRRSPRCNYEGSIVRRIQKSDIGPELARLIDEDEPDEEDIGVFDDDGNLVRVLITEPAYRFFLRKAEEAEDLLDLQIADEFHQSGEKAALEEEYRERNHRESGD
jgi:hypothetical protein